MAVDRPNRNAILILGPDEIKGLINMEEAVAAIAQGYKEADEFPIGNAVIDADATVVRAKELGVDAVIVGNAA